MSKLRVFAFAALAFSLAPAARGATATQPPRSQNERDAESHLRDEAGIVMCDENEFLYGVAYIDGSYMERVFLVRDDMNGPRLEVAFRAPESWPDDSKTVESQDLAPMPFTLELLVPQSRYAVPVGGQWQAPPQEWETALRFKYSNWYGEISRTGGQWKVDWQGFRRPMLPDAVKDEAQQICRRLAEP